MRLKTKQQQVDLSGGHWRSKCLHHRWQKHWLSVGTSKWQSCQHNIPLFCSEPCAQYYQATMAGPFLPDDWLLAPGWRSVGVMIFLMHFEPEFYVAFVSEESYHKRNKLFCHCQCQSDSFNKHFRRTPRPGSSVTSHLHMLQMTSVKLTSVFLLFSWFINDQGTWKWRRRDPGPLQCQVYMFSLCLQASSASHSVWTCWLDWLPTLIGQLMSDFFRVKLLTFWQTRSPRWALITYGWIEEELLVMSQIDFFLSPKSTDVDICNGRFNTLWVICIVASNMMLSVNNKLIC